MDTRMSPEQQWQSLFAAFLKSSAPELNVQVELTKKEIIIKTKNREHLARLQAVLSSPEMAQAGLEYTLTQGTQTVPAPAVVLQEVHYPKPITVAPNSGKDIFKKIFGTKILNRVGRTNWSNELTNVDSRVLYYKVEEGLDSLTQVQLDAYRECLTSATFGELRAAFAEDKSAYRSLSFKKTESVEKKILATHIDKILYSKKDSANRNVLYFDYGLLAACITTPIMEITETNNSENTQPLFQVKINKSHLISYISTIFEEGFILNVTGGNQGLPICFNMQRAVPVDIVLMLQLDCSGSLESVFPDYIKKVKEFLQQVQQDTSYANAEILIKAFSTTPCATKIFSLNNLDAIYAYLDTLKAEGSTALYETMAQGFAEVIPLLVNKKVVVVTFTDGVNYCDDKGEAVYDKGLPELNTQSDIIKSQANPIKLYTIGYGPSYNETKLTELATITAGTHIKLNTIEDFSLIHGHVGEMAKARVIARFLQQIQEQSTQFDVLTYEDELGVGTKALTLPGTFSVGNKQYEATLGGPKLAPAKSNDRTQQMVELADLRAAGNNSVFANNKRRGSAPTVVTSPSAANDQSQLRH
jgi:hypothetical protein